jgi:hypothetical protein
VDRIGDRLKRNLPADLQAFTVLLLLGFFFRVYRLPDVPSGLTWDEGAEGLETIPLFHGRFPLFFPEHGGHEPLLIYLQAASLKLFGWSVFSLRLPTAAITTLALAATFLVSRRLFGARVAWLTTLLQAVALWQVAMSRMAIRPASLIVFAALAVYWLSRWLGEQRPWHSAALCGLFVGVAAYTYTPGRFLVVLVAIAWLAKLLGEPNRLRLIKQGILSGSVACAIFAPLGWYFLRHPDAFSERASQLSIFNPEFGSPLLGWLGSVKASLLMFSFAGETGWDKNIAHQPMFDPLLSVLFVAGVALALWRWRQPSYLLAVVWLAVMILPMTLTAKDLPDFGRVSGIAPAVFLFPAIAAAAVWKRLPATHWLWATGAVVLVVVSWRQYFVSWAGSPGREQVYRPGVLAAGQFAIGRLLSANAPRVVYFGTEEPYDAVTDFLIAGLDTEHPDLAHRLIGYDARYTQVLPPPGAESYLIVPGGPAVTILPPDQGAGAIGDVVRIDGFQIPTRVAPGQDSTFQMEWTPQRAFGASLTFFAHVVDYSGQHTLVSFDHNGFPSSEWQGGEKVLSSFPLAIPSNASAGAYWIEFGAYTDGERRLQQGNGTDHLLLGPVVVAPQAPAGEPAAAEFGGQLGLLPATIQRSGDGLDIHLRWLPSQPVERDYSVFVHVLDKNGRLVAQADGPPADGHWPTQYWLPGVPVDDRQRLTLPPGLLPGQYRVAAGLYRLDTGQRLPTEPAGPEPGSVLIGNFDI